jgi:hypothetical protein
MMEQRSFFPNYKTTSKWSRSVAGSPKRKRREKRQQKESLPDNIS